jgi:two-component system, chemotaxis family, protein-glutamate methylesterase/glutaminase
VKKIRVMIVEDSDVIREFLGDIIGQDPRLEVAASVGSAEEALSILRRVSPDVISMDIRLPGMNGLEATRRIMAEKPTPIVVVAASVEAEDLSIAMNSLRAGALTVLEKPVGTRHQDYASMAERVCTQLAIMSEVKVVGQRGFRPIPRAATELEKSGGSPRRPLPNHPEALQVAGIVASTGGPSALVQLLGGLGKDFPLPILLVQHINASFSGGFVTWLATVCPFSVVIAKEGEGPVSGKIYMAPADRHLRIDHGRLWSDRGDSVCAQRPSGSILFQSMARSLGPQGLGILLTGMGADGAEGLLALREAGGYTIAEDASTAAVYGMPAAAVQLGAVCELLPLPAIAPRILELVAVKEEAV